MGWTGARELELPEDGDVLCSSVLQERVSAALQNGNSDPWVWRAAVTYHGCELGQSLRP